MAEIYRFFDSVPGDTRTYNASDFASYFEKFIEDGLYNQGGKLAVTADGTTMKSTVADGIYFIDGRMYENTSPLLLTHDTAEATLDRIDRLVLRKDLSAGARYIRVFIVKGTPAASPVAPTLTNTQYIQETSLASVRIVAGRTFITQADVTDERPTDLIDPFTDGTRITNLENDKIPYTGATKGVNLNGQNLADVGTFTYKDQKSDGIQFRQFESSVDGKLKTITVNLSNETILKTAEEKTTDGIISFPNQSHAHVTSTGTQSIPSGVNTKVTILNTEANDSQNEFASSRFTAKEGGIYNVRAYIDWGTGGQPTQECFIRAYKNGVALGVLAYTGATKIISGEGMFKIASGDYLELYIEQYSGGTAKTVAFAHMSVLKIC